MRRLPALLLLLGLTLAGCAVSSGADTTAARPDATTTTNDPGPTTTSTTLVEADPDCATAYSGIAVVGLEPGDPSACIRVGSHFRVRFENGFAEPVQITWDGEPVTIDDAFEPGGVVGDSLGVGVHRIQSPHVIITIEVVDPATSRYTAEAMFLREWGDLRPGDGLTDLEAAGISVVLPSHDGTGSTPFCTYGFIAGDPYSPGIMILNGAEIGRLDATAPQHHTASGVRFGATIARVVSLYGDQIELSAAEVGGYLTFLPRDAADRSFALVFETDTDGLVAGFRTGLAGPVRWPDGCLG